MRGSPTNACSQGLFPEAARHRDQKDWVCLVDLKKAGWLEGSEWVGYAVGRECIGL